MWTENKYKGVNDEQINEVETKTTRLVDGVYFLRIRFSVENK